MITAEAEDDDDENRSFAFTSLLNALIYFSESLFELLCFDSSNARATGLLVVRGWPENTKKAYKSGGFKAQTAKRGS